MHDLEIMNEKQQHIANIRITQHNITSVYTPTNIVTQSRSYLIQARVIQIPKCLLT